MNTTMDAQTLVKQRNQVELWVAGLAVFVPASILFVHKFWLYAYFTDGDLLSVFLLVLGLPLGPSFLYAAHVKKKLSLHLGEDYKNNPLGEMNALRKINDPKIWKLYEQKSRLMFICLFLGFAQISLAYATFAYFA